MYACLCMCMCACSSGLFWYSNRKLCTFQCGGTMNVCTLIRIYEGSHSMYVQSCIYRYMHTHVYAHDSKYMYVYMYIYIHIYMYKHFTYIHTHIHTYIDMHTHRTVTSLFCSVDLSHFKAKLRHFRWHFILSTYRHKRFSQNITIHDSLNLFIIRNSRNLLLYIISLNLLLHMILSTYWYS